jgi:uncharacterized protein (TIGR03435 family)
MRLLLLLASCAVAFGQQTTEVTVDSLKALQGKAVVLEFWATWCGPCIAAIPHWNQLATQFREKPVVFLSVSDESRDTIERFLAKKPIEGIVGLSKDRKVFDAYGVTGVGRTFLIDAAGKIAADLTPDRLTPAMLDDLLAGHAITLPPKPAPFSTTIREVDNPMSKPVFDVMIRPTMEAGRGGGSGRGKGELMMRATTVKMMLPGLYLVPPPRIVAPDIDDTTRYDVWISLPGSDGEAFRQVTRDVVCAAFRLSARKESRETDVYVLAAPNGKPPGLVEAVPMGGIFSGSGKGSLRVTGPMMSLASMLERPLGKPVIDETGLNEAYEIRLKYEDGVAGSLEAEVAKLGLKLVPARRPIEYLIVTKGQ